MKQLINKIKENNEDFEFYPSTKEMIQVISNDIKNNVSNRYPSNTFNVLDVGCGNGNALNLIYDCFDNGVDEYNNQLNTNIHIKKFGIEKCFDIHTKIEYNNNLNFLIEYKE